jgi:uncharacterized membrane protein YuzA (DUF378 family)
MQPVDLIWTIVGFLLTLMVFSYLFGDNPLFRLVTYLFVGVTAGFAAVMVIYHVLMPRLVFPFLDGPFGPQTGLVIVPLVLGVLLLLKLFPRTAVAGEVPMAFLVGVGAAVIIGGAILGTLFTQTMASINLFDFDLGAQMGQNPLMRLLEGVVLLAGTIGTLIYFHFSARTRGEQAPQRPRLVELISSVGQVFLAITLGALFAGVFATTVTALVNRVDFLRDAIVTIISFF